MSLFSRIDLIDPYTCSPLVFRETSIIEPSPLLLLGFPSFIDDDVKDLTFLSPTPLDLFESVVRIEKSPSSCRIRRRLESEYPLRYLCDRVSELETKFDRVIGLGPKRCGSESDRKYILTKEIKGCGDRKYIWEAEIQGPPLRKYKMEAELEGSTARKYKLEAEIEGFGERKCKNYGGKKELVTLKKAKAKALAEAEKKKRYNWTTEVKSEKVNGEMLHTYKIKASIGRFKGKEDEKEKKKKKKRVVVIEEDDETQEHGALVLRKAFNRRSGVVRAKKGKNQEMSDEYAVVTIQRAFRAYLIRRSKALRGLRHLAIAKTKLKELIASFHNFSYRRVINRDAEEQQKFSEKIIVLLLTVDAIEGVDVMVRGVKRSMVDELEAMLDVVDPQPKGKSLSMRRRTLDMPESLIRKGIAEGVTQIVHMLETDQE